MAADEYDKVELPALVQLQSLGWDYLHGSELAPDASIERSSFRVPVLAARLTRLWPAFEPLEGDPRYEAIQTRMIIHLNEEREALGLGPIAE
jgi:hypothetical protein